MSVALRLQVPGSPGNLLEELRKACAVADRGGALFAWINRTGVHDFIGDAALADLCGRGPFDLVVGVDAITDPYSLQKLKEHSAELPNLNVSVFLHGSRDMFHPKLAWFVRDSKVTLITGSGNLTGGGLQKNWEAFTLAVVDGDEADAVLAAINGWLEVHKDALRGPDDPQVLERATRNRYSSERDLKRVGELQPEPLPPELDVLVTEVSRAGRVSQVDFGKHAYRGFFQVEHGTKRQITFQDVDDDGTVGPPEVRASIATKSQNYRFELAAGVSRSYPSSGRPIVVAMRIGEGKYLYQFLFPGDPGHSELDAYLDDELPAHPAHLMRRVHRKADEVRAAWPDSALWDATN